MSGRIPVRTFNELKSSKVFPWKRQPQGSYECQILSIRKIKAFIGLPSSSFLMLASKSETLLTILEQSDECEPHRVPFDYCHL